MNNQEKNRLSVALRVRPYTGSSLDLVLSWLKSLDPQDKRLRVEEALTIMYIVQAKIWSEAELAEIQSAYLLMQQALEKHCSNLQLQYPNLLAPQEAPSNIRPKLQDRNIDVDNLFG